ncbi:MAG: FtsW/RodA/SpoVE family cell cycle protein [Beutenbergiaceae bacterium]
MSAISLARPRPARAIASWRTAIWASPTTSYYLVAGAALLLLVLGLVMVLSASMVDSLNDSAAAGEGFNPFRDFRDQIIFAAIGLPLAFIASRFRPEWFRRLAWLGLVGALGLQLLLFVPSLSRTVGGNSNWVDLGPITFQPSEFAKLGLAIWLGAVLATKGKLLRQWRHALVPAVLVAAMFLAFVLRGHDLGTALILMALVAGALWVAGVPASLFLLLGSFAAATATFLVFSSVSRRNRVLQFLGMNAESNPLGADFQPRLGLEALGSGGISGVGLGASRIKWRGLPAAADDYIFAIIGEELGLLGALLVIGLFLMLALGLSRVIKRHPDPFAKITTAAIGAWIIGQAFVNIGVVIGLLPVIGVPLPLVSAGGSSLITTLVALGVVLSFARSEPGARQAFAARRGSVRRSLAVLAPRLGASSATRTNV